MSRRVILVCLVLLLLMATQGFAFLLVTYVVRSGDSIHTVSRELGVSMSTIIDFNNLSNPSSIKAGDRLFLPQPDGLIYNVQSGDTLESIAKAFFAPVESLFDTNNLKKIGRASCRERV